MARSKRSMRNRNRKSFRSRGRRNLRSQKRTLTRKQKQLKSRKSLLNTLNQMGGYVRDGSTQFFKILKSKN